MISNNNNSKNYYVIRDSRRLFAQMVSDPDNKELMETFVSTVRAESRSGDRKNGFYCDSPKNRVGKIKS
jgi:hypothetical protein